MNQKDTSSASVPTRWARGVISVFIILNLGTVLYVNLPAGWSARKYQQWTSGWDPITLHRLSRLNWRFKQYAHLTGLSNQWQMFGKQSPFNWNYDIRALYGNGADGHLELLPLPNQSERSWAEKWLFDFRERKFALNIYANPLARNAYMRYLSRRYPSMDSLPVTEIRWKLRYQKILPPDEAVAQQKLVSDEVHSIDFGFYRVPTARKSP